MKIISSLLFLILFDVFNSSYGQRFKIGTCPPLMSAKTLTFAALKEKLYREYARTTAVQYHTWRCTTYTFTEIALNFKFKLAITGRDKITGKSVTTTGAVEVGGQTIMATLTEAGYLTFTTNQGGKTKKVDYYVISVATDAKVLVLYACKDIAFMKLESVIVLVLSTATGADIDKALKALTANGFPLTALKLGYDGAYQKRRIFLFGDYHGALFSQSPTDEKEKGKINAN